MPATGVDGLVAESAAHDAAGRYAQALALSAEALAACPNDPELLFARGSTLFHWERFHEARDAYLAAEAAGLKRSALYLQLGWTCLYVGRLDEAERWMRDAVATQADEWVTHFGLAVVLRAQKQTDAAVSAYERGLALSRDNVNCLINLAVCKIYQDEPVAAETLLRRAVSLSPDRAMAWDNLGVSLHRQERFPEAFDAFERAEQLEIETGEDVDSFVNFGNALREGHRIKESLDRFESRLADHPNVYGHGQYALALLTAGRFKEGWQQYEFRWIQEPLRSQRTTFSRPTWTGQSLRGKTILLRSEQGFGDTLQFIRYAPLVKAMGATVFVQVRPGLERLTADLPGIDRFVRHGEPVPEFDFHICFMSLPHVFGCELTSIPADVPYLTVPSEYASRWEGMIPVDGTLRVGLAWAGNPAHLQDRHRSLPSGTLASLADLQGVHFYSLQKDMPAAVPNSRDPGLEVTELGAELHDFSDTAAAIEQLDLVISVDTAVAHLAGALGKPVWLMLPRSGDWRWLQGREDSPWYPTMRLFRQDTLGEWNTTVERIKTALQSVLDGNRAALAPVRDPRHERIGAVTQVVYSGAASNAPTALSRVAEARFGIFQCWPDRDDASTSLVAYGEYRHLELSFLAKFVGRTGTVMEIGAGIGAHSLFLSRAVGEDGHLFLQESSPILRRLLLQNLIANQAQNVTLMMRALGGPTDDDVAAYGTGTTSPGVVESTVSSHTDTLDELQLERLNVLKINDGTVARDVIDGSSDTLWRLRPLLFIAVNELETGRALASQLRQFGYRSWQVSTSLFNPANFNCRDADVFVEGNAEALLAMPEEVELSLALEGYPEVL